MPREKAPILILYIILYYIHRPEWTQPFITVKPRKHHVQILSEQVHTQELAGAEQKKDVIPVKTGQSLEGAKVKKEFKYNRVCYRYKRQAKKHFF